MSRTTRRASGLLVELGVVVLGVLIALAADAWWENRQEDARAGEYLDALVVEVGAATVQLEQVQASTDSLLAEMEAFLRAIRSDGRLPEATPVMRMVPFALPIGSLDALVETGDLRLVSDAGVRVAIIRSRAVLRDELRVHHDWQRTAQENVRDVAAAMAAAGAGVSEPPLPSAMRGNARLIGAYDTHRVALLNQFRATSAILDALATLSEALAVDSSP